MKSCSMLNSFCSQHKADRFLCARSTPVLWWLESLGAVLNAWFILEPCEQHLYLSIYIQYIYIYDHIFTIQLPRYPVVTYIFLYFADFSAFHRGTPDITIRECQCKLWVIHSSARISPVWTDAVLKPRPFLTCFWGFWDSLPFKSFAFVNTKYTLELEV